MKIYFCLLQSPLAAELNGDEAAGVDFDDDDLLDIVGDWLLSFDSLQITKFL